MSLKQNYQASLEAAIKYQHNGKLFPKLTELFDQHISQSVNISRDVEKLVMDETGLKITLKVEAFTNAYIMPFQLSTQNSLFQDYTDPSYEEYSSMYTKIIQKNHRFLASLESLKGSIDFDKARVSGVFSKLEMPIVMGSGLWTQCKMTAEEVTAVFLHELGHGFTFLAGIIEVLTVNQAISSTIGAMKKCPNREVHVELALGLAKHLKLDDEGTKAMTEAKASHRNYSVIYLKAAYDRKKRSAAGSTTYDRRSAEFMADQFAVRMGAGKALATGMDKLFQFNPLYKAHGAKRALLMFLRFVATWAALIFTGIGLFMAFATLFTGTWEDEIYDMDGERLRRMRNDLVQNLKEAKSQEEKTQLLEYISVVDKTMERINDDRTLYTYLWISLTSTRRGQYRQMRIQQDLEKMIGSGLNVNAARLASL